MYTRIMLAARRTRLRTLIGHCLDPGYEACSRSLGTHVHLVSPRLAQHIEHLVLPLTLGTRTFCTASWPGVSVPQMAWPTSWYATSDLDLPSTMGVPSMPATMRSTLSSISLLVIAALLRRPVRIAACTASTARYSRPCKRAVHQALESSCHKWVHAGVHELSVSLQGCWQQIASRITVSRDFCPGSTSMS